MFPGTERIAGRWHGSGADHKKEVYEHIHRHTHTYTNTHTHKNKPAHANSDTWTTRMHGLHTRHASMSCMFKWGKAQPSSNSIPENWNTHFPAFWSGYPWAGVCFWCPKTYAHIDKKMYKKNREIKIHKQQKCTKQQKYFSLIFRAAATCHILQKLCPSLSWGGGWIFFLLLFCFRNRCEICFLYWGQLRRQKHGKNVCNMSEGGFLAFIWGGGGSRAQPRARPK